MAVTVSGSNADSLPSLTAGAQRPDAIFEF